MARVFAGVPIDADLGQDDRRLKRLDRIHRHAFKI